jgi:hypothetical protein
MKKERARRSRGTDLVAREGQDFESFILVGLIKGLKLGVVDVGLASLGGDIDNDANLSPIV